MGKTRHEKTFVDFEHPYERNIIGLRGIIYFGIGLFLLIIIAFGLMWFFMKVLEQEAREGDRQNANPMMMSERERLPPEPRLQVAPGFGVDVKDEGRVNLELKEPQAEWQVLRKQYQEIWEKGEKAPDGTIVALPIDEAKEKFLEQKKEGGSGERNENIMEEARSIVSDSSAGRRANEKKRY